MSTHAPFAPSSAERWMACTGSFGLSLTVGTPEVESSYAAEGSRLHEVAAGWLTPGTMVVGNKDMAFLKPYLDYATKRIAEATTHAIEERIEYSDWLSGTADLLLFDKDLLEVVDLKTGAGVMVSPDDNPQLLTYAYMVLQRLIYGKLPDVIRLTIVQPPDTEDPVKSWECTPSHVLAHGMRAEIAIAAALSGSAVYTPGEHCRWCKAKAICPKLRGEMVEALAAALPSTMTPPQLAAWLDRADRMEAFIKALRETGHAVATEAAQRGVAGIPGWGLKPKRATRQWVDEETVLAIARRRKIKIYQDRLLSPAMAEKAHPALPQELRDQIVAVSSGSNLVRTNEPHEVAPTLPGLVSALLNARYRV